MAAWYKDTERLTYVQTYKDNKAAQRDMEAAARNGWAPQVTTAAGHVNFGRTLTKGVLTGGIGLMTGASRSKGTITVTYTRTAEWHAWRQAWQEYYASQGKR